MDGHRVFPHFCRPCFLKSVQSFGLSPPVYKATASTEAHALGPLRLTSKRRITHSCSREAEHSDQQLKKKKRGYRNCQHKQLLNFHCKSFSSTLRILCILEMAFHPQKQPIKEWSLWSQECWGPNPFILTQKLLPWNTMQWLRFWLCGEDGLSLFFSICVMGERVA